MMGSFDGLVSDFDLEEGGADGLAVREYLFQWSKGNEDLALAYFREMFGDTFKR